LLACAQKSVDAQKVCRPDINFSVHDRGDDKFGGYTGIIARGILVAAVQRVAHVGGVVREEHGRAIRGVIIRQHIPHDAVGIPVGRNRGCGAGKTGTLRRGRGGIRQAVGVEISEPSIGERKSRQSIAVAPEI